MKIVLKNTLPDGTQIQLEDWSEHNTPEFPNLYGLQIGAYPIAVNTGAYQLVRTGERFRLTIAMNSHTGYSNEDVFADYEALVHGKKSLQDLAAHFWNLKKDEWYLGMFTPGTDEWCEAQNRYGVKARF